MKNIAAIAIFTLALVSCKKETATVTKVDPKTGKTITVEVPADSVKKVAENPAIVDSSGVYKQTFKLEKGKSYPLTIYQRDVSTMSDPTGKTANGTKESTDEMSFTVNDIKGNVYDISVNLLGKRVSQSAEGKTVVVDTKQPIPKEDQLKMIWNVNKAMTGNKLALQMDSSGKIISIKGFDPIYAKISTAISSMVKDPAQKEAIVKNFKTTFNEEVLKEQLETSLLVLPAKGVKVGEKWTKTENVSEDGKVKISSNYTLNSVGNGIAEISVSGGMPKKSDKRSQDGITHSLTSELSQNGTIKFDQNTGWIHHQNVSVKTTEAETYSDGKQSQTMKVVNNSSIMVNPSNK